ncbi:hypothetical protein BDV25DRAFT_149131 [Aspergillus avenaceus]|uniref:Uncharacterized protein n=1 Tax=Aspergillus avenaceus TaxID=36643 RepID=A0A5N6U4L3_ASPAV|nr:hypothetical protein BDV25DRAFT_149131 [Aspergillus avenaceus]
MKVLRPVFFILAASQVVDAHPAELQEGPFTGEVTVSNAIPASDFNLEEYFDKGDLSSPVLDKRSTCQVIDRVIRKIGTNQNKVVYITSGASLGLAICNLTHADQCNMVGLAIGASLSIIFALANDYSGGEPVPVPELPGPASLKEGTYMSAVKAAMSSSALEYAEILPAPLHDTTEKRSDDEPDLLERFLIKGLRSADNTTGHNIFVHHYSNGGSVLHVPVSDDVATDNLHKRYDHPGLKISYTTRMKSSLPKSRQRDMASSIGSMWEYYAKTARMDEYIGFEEENGKANFYFRIIPETRGFGENYESVDVCGGMAGYL